MAAFAYHQTVPQRAWTKVTDAPGTGIIRLQNRGGAAVLLRAASALPSQPPAVGASQPADVELAYNLGYARLTFANDFPGATGATDLYAWAENNPTILSVSHA